MKKANPKPRYRWRIPLQRGSRPGNRRKDADFTGDKRDPDGLPISGDQHFFKEKNLPGKGAGKKI
jgi:hypothetical protein